MSLLKRGLVGVSGMMKFAEPFLRAQMTLLLDHSFGNRKRRIGDRATAANGLAPSKFTHS